MQHYYDEHGNIQFGFSETMKEILESAFPERYKTQLELKRVRSLCMEAAVEAEYDYEMTSLIGDISGKEFITVEDNLLTKSIKKMLLTFIDAGFLRHDFKLAIWDTICEIQFNWVMDNAINTTLKRKELK